jgi:anti-sigma B factor antagonist
MGMSFELDRRDGVAVAVLAGEIDLQQAPALRRGLLDCLREKTDMIVDLAGVLYIDSSGIACLVEAYQTARKAGAYFALAAVSPGAMRVLQLSRLDLVFTIREKVEDALAERG